MQRQTNDFYYVRPGFLETNLSQNSDLSLRFYSNLRNLKKMHFSKKNLAQILTNLRKNLSYFPTKLKPQENRTDII
jgi:hypothetical protein